MPGPAAVAAGGALADNADEVAGVASDSVQAASDSKGFNILLVLIGLAGAYYAVKVVSTGTEVAEDAADGAGDAADGVGDAAGETFDGAGEAAGGVGGAVGDAWDGTTDVWSDGLDFAAGGTAETVNDVDDVVGGLLG